MGLPVRSASAALELVATNDDYVVATVGNVLLVHFRRRTPLAVVEACRDGLRRLGRTVPSVVFFAVIELESDPPDDATRKAFTRLFEDEERRLGLAVIASKGEGVRGAMVRTVISGIFSLAPSFRLAFPRHVVASVEAAADRAAPALVGVGRDAIVRCFDELGTGAARR